MIRGTFTALVTPFKDHEVDEESFRKHIQFQIDNGVDGIVPCGTTGETVTLTPEEYKKVISIAIEEAKGKVPVVAGTGSNNTETVIETTKVAGELGADACLVVTPYYNKPPQEGLYQHYTRVARETKIPIVLYNVPSRTGCNLEPRTVARLAELDQIIALKEASGQLKQVCDVISLCRDKITILSGDDYLAFPLMSVGGHGVISVASNVIPEGISSMISAALSGEWDKARKLHYRFKDLCDMLFIETNPIPVKTALAMMGRMQPEFRLPLWRMSQKNEGPLAEILFRHHLIKTRPLYDQRKMAD